MKLKALLFCLLLASVLNIPKLLSSSSLGDVLTDIGTSAIVYWLIYLLWVGVAAAFKKSKGVGEGEGQDEGEGTATSNEGENDSENVSDDGL